MNLKILLLIPVASSLLFAESSNAAKRLGDSATVINEMMGADDKGIPQSLIDSSSCVVVIPGLLKGAFIFGGKYGRGYMTCRNDNGIGWKSPAAVRVEGGSFGLQIGGSATDVIMIVKSEKGAEKLMQSRFTVGGEASAAAGPLGRNTTAMTDAQMRAEILSWSRSRGVFGGLSLEGATLREDQEANQDIYGKKLSSKDVLTTMPPAPASAKPLIEALTKYSGRAGKKS